MLDDRRSDIIRSIQAGEPYDVIGRRWGVTRQRIYQIAKNAGTTSASPSGKPLAPEKVRQALELFVRGMPATHIAEMVGVSDTTIWKLAKRQCGYQPSPAPPEWDTRAINFLVDHWKRPGWTASRIAPKVGRTRNAVIGMAHRLGL